MSADRRGNYVDPITVEVIGSALSSIVEEMGEALVRASFSTNIKERRGFSAPCANARAISSRMPQPVALSLAPL